MSELRFTDDPPPPSVLENIPNWVHAYGEEGRRGQDETTIKPQRQQQRIDRDTDYTTGDVWLANDERCLGLLWLSSGQITAIEVYDGDAPWCVRRDGATGTWGMDPYRNPAGVRLDDAARFPLRYCSRLPYERRRPIKGVINADGTWSEWETE